MSFPPCASGGVSYASGTDCGIVAGPCEVTSCSGQDALGSHLFSFFVNDDLPG